MCHGKCTLFCGSTSVQWPSSVTICFNTKPVLLCAKTDTLEHQPRLRQLRYATYTCIPQQNGQRDVVVAFASFQGNQRTDNSDQEYLNCPFLRAVPGAGSLYTMQYSYIGIKGFWHDTGCWSTRWSEKGKKNAANSNPYKLMRGWRIHKTETMRSERGNVCKGAHIDVKKSNGCL